MRYKCVISYDGTAYMGFQIQPNCITVEEELELAIKKMFDVEAKVTSSGRTDRLVHALGQVIHFDLDKNLGPNNLKRGLNSFLPEDIHIISVEKVTEEFHARFSAKSKEYHYFINIGEYNPILRNYMPNITNLDIDIMEEAIKKFIGTHDFKGFASAQIDPRKDTVKTIYQAEIKRLDDKLEFIFVGTGFLKYQVRKMMGILVEIGFHKADVNKIDLIFETKDPKLSHKILTGAGLFLYKVNY